MADTAIREQTFLLATGQAKTVRAAFPPASPPSGGADAWQVRFRLYAPDRALLLTLTLGSGVTLVNGTTGVWDIALAATDTAGLAPGTHLWDFWRTDTDYPLAFGECQVYNGVAAG